MTKLNSKGFTLIEFLIVIAIIAILSAVVFVALDPLTRFKDTRDSRRWSDIASILDAIKIDQVDNGGAYLPTITALTDDEVYMIAANANITGCDDNCSSTIPVTDDDNCVDLSGLVTEGYLADISISPKGSHEWNASTTGYTISRSSTGAITIEACEAENTPGGILLKR